MALWLVRDNAVNRELGFLEHDVPVQGPTHASNFIAALFSNARGATEPVAFSVDEVRQAAGYFKSFFLPVMFGLPPDADLTTAERSADKSARLIPISAKGVNRLSRLLYFLSAARAANDDELLRQLIQTVASNAVARKVFEMDDSRLEDYFTKLAIGMPSPDEV